MRSLTTLIYQKRERKELIDKSGIFLQVQFLFPRKHKVLTNKLQEAVTWYCYIYT